LCTGVRRVRQLASWPGVRACLLRVPQVRQGRSCRKPLRRGRPTRHTRNCRHFAGRTPGPGSPSEPGDSWAPHRTSSRRKLGPRGPPCEMSTIASVACLVRTERSFRNGQSNVEGIRGAQAESRARGMAHWPVRTAPHLLPLSWKWTRLGGAAARRNRSLLAAPSHSYRVPNLLHNGSP
jgi:hypothetical protein